MTAKKTTYTTDVMIYPHNDEDHSTITQLLLTALESYEIRSAPSTSARPHSWNRQFRNTGFARLACSVYGTRDEIVGIEKKIRRLSRGKVRFDFETSGLWIVTDGFETFEAVG